MAEARDNSELVAVALQYASELDNTIQHLRSAIEASKPTLGDRAAGYTRLLAMFSTGGPLAASGITDPAIKALATLGGARRLGSEVYFKTQQQLFESGSHEKLKAIAPDAAARIESSYFGLNRAIQDALSEEKTWGVLPERVASGLMEQIFGGFLKAVMELLVQLLRVLENLGKTALQLVTFAEKVTAFIAKWAIPITIGIAALYLIPWAWPRVKSLSNKARSD